MRLVQAIVVVLIVGSVAAIAHAQPQPRGGPGSAHVTLPAPCPNPTCAAPCVLRFPFNTCESKRTQVTLEFTAEGAGCNYVAKIDWGDGHLETVRFTQPPGIPQDDDPSLHPTHMYGQTGQYVVQLSVTELAGMNATCDSGAPLNLRYYVGILRGHYDLVALGDSYSAGEGTWDYDNPVCHRSPVAWSRLLPARSERVRSVELLACSGAVSADLTGRGHQPDQISALRSTHANLVTVTIGGNDVGFAPTLSNCFLLHCLTADYRLNLKIGRESKLLVQDYLEIAHAAPRARILVVDYPQLFPVRADLRPINLDPTGVHTADCTWLTADDGAALNELANSDDAMNATIATAVGRANTELEHDGSDNRIEFVDVSKALQAGDDPGDHGFCTADPWVNNLNLALGVLKFTELGHPNVRGQNAIADVVARYINHQL